MKSLRAPFAKLAAVALCLAGIMCSYYSTGARAQSVTPWLQFLGSPSHNSYIATSSISTSNASQLGVKWMANLYSSDLGSPIIAYNNALNKAVVYVGDERGDVYAVDANTGQLIWSNNVGIGDSVRASPAVASDGTVWIGTSFDATLYKLDGGTGKVMCSLKSPNGKAIFGSPLIVTPPGGSETVYWVTVDNSQYGAFVSTNEATCGQNFSVQVTAGSWATPSYAVNGAGEALVLIGTADPTCNENAYDALSGNAVWSVFLALKKPCLADVGNASSISAPGVNGFRNGVAYIADDDGEEFALDLNSGSQLWMYPTYPTSYTGKRYQISTQALDGNQIVYSYYNGVNSLNATTGALLWTWNAVTGVDSTPLIAGPAGAEIVAFADLAGKFHVVALSSGAELYNFQTGSYISASAAVYNGTIYITSADGFLYAFAPGGGNGSKPSESIASPTNGAVVANPNGSLSLSGSAADGSRVVAVEIAIQSGGSSGPWYNATTNTWGSAPFRNEAALTSPGASSTTWSYSVPLPASGGNYEVFASTVNGSNLVDKGSAAYFSVSPSLNEPTIHTSLFDVPPGSTFTASGNAFKPGETVTFTLLGNSVATATVGTTGNVPQTMIQVPSNAAFGPTSLTVTGNSSGKSASTQIYVSNAWTQYGYSALRTAMEPNDYVINHTIFVGASVLNIDWMYPSGAAINTTPAVKDGIAYFGNDAGTLSAVTVATGSPVWTYTIPSGLPIHSSPAIDDTGQLIFGASDGKLYVVSPSGAPVTSISLGGDLDAPAYANKKIVIGSSSGQVYSLNDPAWTTNWSINAGSPVSVPPAYDAPAGLVFVGTGNGNVIAYSSATGVVKWTATTGGSIHGMAIADHHLYVGSADSYVYAYAEGTGALLWKLAGDGSPVTALDTNGNGPAFGTVNGNMYNVTATGTIYYQRQYTVNQIAGLAGAGTDEFASTTNGNLQLLRSADGSWHYVSGGKYTVGPVILNGILFQGAGNGNFYAFTPQGYTVAPQSSQRVGNLIVNIDGSGSCLP